MTVEGPVASGSLCAVKACVGDWNKTAQLERTRHGVHLSDWLDSTDRKALRRETHVSG